VASFYARARRKWHQNFFFADKHEESGINLPKSTKKMASFYIVARRKRHHFALEHEESCIKICCSTKNPASKFVVARRILHHFTLQHEESCIKPKNGRKRCKIIE